MAHRPDAPVERASLADRAFLAMDSGGVPEQFGVVLVLDPTAAGAGVPDVARVREQIAARLGAVPRLRQRLVGTPLGAGGPVWVDDPGFDVLEHVHAVACPAPGDEQALLDRALAVVMTPLPRRSPLWSVTAVTGLADGGWALVMVMHHLLADGLGGLAVLGALVDRPLAAPGSGDRAFPRSAPARGSLYSDALRRLPRRARSMRGSFADLRAALGAAGGVLPTRAAATSLVQRTGPHRAARVVHIDLEALREATHPWGASANDAVLVAVGSALAQVQSARGEALTELAVAVPVSGRIAGQSGEVGNMVSPLLVPVPTEGDLVTRLTTVSERVRSRRAAATGPPPIALLGWLFRSLARHGGFRWYMNHQHRLHTLVTHVRGPRERLSFDGGVIVKTLPVVVGESGNVTVQFAGLSYAGDLALTVIADPDHFPDLDLLVDALSEEMDRLAALARPASA